MRAIPIFSLLLVSTSASSITSFIPSHHPAVLPRRHQRHALFAASEDDGSSSTSKSARDRGIYSRPSAAIERGSGFFIPGLEGPRIRLLFGITVLIADAANHLLAESQPGDVGQIIAESTAAFYGALLLLQGVIESGGQRSSQELDTSLGASGDVGVNQSRASEVISDKLKSNEGTLKSIQRVAKTIIDFTPTKYVMFVDQAEGVAYSLNTINGAAPTSNDASEQLKLINLALDAVSESRGGRVALPSEHPVSKLLPSSVTRCILVQKVNGYGDNQSCLVMGSDSLLPSYTKNDLRWIGQLADTVKS